MIPDARTTAWIVKETIIHLFTKYATEFADVGAVGKIANLVQALEAREE